MKILMNIQMENHKSEVERVTHLKSHRHIYTFLYLFWNSVTSRLMPSLLQILTKKGILPFK